MTGALMCLAMAIYFEARSEPVVGQFAVAEVIVNRVDSPRFPDEVCAVVQQDLGPEAWDCQFSFYCDGRPEKIDDERAWAVAQAIARDVLEVPNAPDVTGGALFYHTVDVSPKWSRDMRETAVYGRHIFFSDEVILADNNT